MVGKFRLLNNDVVIQLSIVKSRDGQGLLYY